MKYKIVNPQIDQTIEIQMIMQNLPGVAGIWESSTDQEKRRTYNDFSTMMDFHDSFSNFGYELLDWERIAR
ncbi:MAG: hypothetical protein KGY51_01710 [Psychroflexus sp.]|nr:hypothetical protein [Psychroflexus sp.]